MRQNKIIGVIFTLLSVLLVFESSSASVYANSAQSWWEGVDSSGAIITEEDSPIVVEKEVLTFDLQEFPANYYREVEDYLAYDGKVTASYTFYNPADYTVTAKLRFPFGNIPDYGYIYDMETDTQIYNVDTEKYNITINGEVIEKTIRHSLSYPHAQFNLEKDMVLLLDEYVEDVMYYPEQTVTKYTYKISGVDLEEYHAANVAFDVEEKMNSTIVFFPGQSGGHTQKNGDMRISAWVEENGQRITLYAFGKPFSAAPKWKCYKNGGVEDKEAISGTVSLESTETFTFEEFALADWEEQFGVSKTDWYNAVIAELREDAEHYQQPIVQLERYKQGYQGYLMRWYEYEVSLEPGERITNIVTAPIYPSINGRYAPIVYGYKYLLSPAKTWKEFGELEIHINTPYFLGESSIEGFTKTNDGYTLTLEGLPKGELEFTLCSSENPAKAVIPAREYVPTEMIVCISVIGAVFLVGAGILVVKHKRKKIKS